MSRPLSAADRGRVVALLHEGHSCRATARAVGCGLATVSRVAAADGTTLERSRTRRATEARRDYAQAERLALLNQVFDKAAALLPSITTPAQLQAFAVAVGILIDKRRLEDGDATVRTDVIDHGARERIERRIDELAARRLAADTAVARLTLIDGD